MWSSSVGSGLVIVSHRHQFVFVKTRKTAGTSVEMALSRFVGSADVVTPMMSGDEELRLDVSGHGAQNFHARPWRWSAREWARLATRRKAPVFYNHMPAETIRRYLGPRTWDRYFKFTIDRNPWDLAVSAYFWERRKFPDRTFEEFVSSERLPRYSNWRLYTIDGALAVNQVMRYDQLEESLSALIQPLGLPESLQLPRAKAGFRTDRRPYQDWYDDITRGRVAEVFHREIDTFGWTFD